LNKKEQNYSTFQVVVCMDDRLSPNRCASLGVIHIKTFGLFPTHQHSLTSLPVIGNAVRRNPSNLVIANVVKQSPIQRWDMEISIREIKTLMDINVLRGKSPDILLKELVVSLAACNTIRKIIARSADKVGFSPQENIFQECAGISRPLLLDRKGRVFHRWSPGRYGKTIGPNK
jgi:hypothetical protein